MRQTNKLYITQYICKHVKTCLVLFLIISAHLNLLAQTNKLTLKQVVDSAKANNPRLLNEALRPKFYELKGSGSDLHSTEINYSYGNIYSTRIDKSLSISQNFGSPVAWFAQKAFRKQMQKLGTAESELNSKLIIASVKAAYFNSVYCKQKLNLLKDVLSACAENYPFDSIQSEKNDSLILEKIYCESALSDLEINYNAAYNDYLISKNNLVQQAFLNKEAEPANSQLEMYELEVNSDTSTRTPSNLYRNLYLQQYLLANKKVKLEKSKFFPEIKAGYSFNSINGANGFSVWQVGISLPIWFCEQNTKVKGAKLEQQFAQNEFNWQHSNIDATTANLLTEMNKYFEQISYFDGYSLKQAQSLIDISKRLFEAKKISYYKHIQNIQAAYKVKLNYLDAIINYNLKAIELEVYAY
jgi:heavy metal efflux system protein